MSRGEKANKLPDPPLRDCRVWVNVEIDLRHVEHSIAANELQAVIENALQGYGRVQGNSLRIHSVTSAGKTLKDEDKRWRAKVPAGDMDARLAKFNALSTLQQTIVMQCANHPQTLSDIFAPHRGTHSTQAVAQAITDLKMSDWLVPVELATPFETAIKPSTRAAITDVINYQKAVGLK